MLEAWIIFQTPNYPFVIRHYFGHGRTRVFARGAVLARTLEEARDRLPKGRGLRPCRSREQDVVEVWLPPASVEAIRRRVSVR